MAWIESWEDEMVVAVKDSIGILVNDLQDLHPSQRQKQLHHTPSRFQIPQKTARKTSTQPKPMHHRPIFLPISPVDLPSYSVLTMYVQTARSLPHVPSRAPRPPPMHTYLPSLQGVCRSHTATASPNHPGGLITLFVS